MNRLCALFLGYIHDHLRDISASSPCSISRLKACCNGMHRVSPVPAGHAAHSGRMVEQLDPTSSLGQQSRNACSRAGRVVLVRDLTRRTYHTVPQDVGLLCRVDVGVRMANLGWSMYSDDPLVKASTAWSLGPLPENSEDGALSQVAGCLDRTDVLCSSNSIRQNQNKPYSTQGLPGLMCTVIRRTHMTS
jgi:hypothetical protein